ncbi:MAG: hypothetical protein ACM3PW_00510, partial [Chlamydiota bacterium]
MKCGRIFLHAAESKFADFYFLPREQIFFSSPPAIVFYATLQERFPPLGFSSPATPRFAVDNEVQPAPMFRAPIPNRVQAGPMKPKRTILCVDDNEQSLSIRK